MVFRIPRPKMLGRNALGLNFSVRGLIDGLENVAAFKSSRFFGVSTPSKTNMAMENPPFEDVFPVEHGDFPTSC